jgi:predicted enzyme related to lactoylglutathione lyase
MAVGKLMCHVFDVEDLEVGQAFWSAVTGIPPIPSFFPGRYAYLGQPDPWRQEVILHLVTTPKGEAANRSHVDIWVRDVDAALDQIEALGGRRKKPPAVYPRPGSYGDEPARIDWAVAQDPFGNEFCVITLLTPDESAAVRTAAERDPAQSDHDWRVAAGRTAPH